jgi:hypothetical protein
MGGLLANAAEMFITDSKKELGGLLWLPCQVGRCMIDTGGLGGALMTTNPETALFAKDRTILVNSLQGVMECDLLQPQSFELASKQIYSKKMIRCEDISITSSVDGIHLVLPKFPLEINGEALVRNAWRVVPIKKSFQQSYVPEVMLGMNLIELYDWQFDTRNGRAKFERIGVFH